MSFWSGKSGGVVGNGGETKGGRRGDVVEEEEAHVEESGTAADMSGVWEESMVSRPMRM